MKKTLFVLLFISIVLVGCSSEKEVSISEKDKYVGIWTMVGQEETKEGNTITASTIQFYEDGTCHFAYTLKPKTSSLLLEGTSNGECYLNESNTKFKMEGQGSIFKEWTEFSESNGYIKINNWTYEKK
jgi:hypothetical protein